jgi:hypothetical protein
MRMPKNLAARGAGAIVAVTAMAALTLAGSGTANASVPGGVTMRNVNTGRCIDDSFGYGLRSYGCNGLSYQQWIFQGPTLVLKNANTLRCMDDSSGYGLRSYGCNGLDYQQWVEYTGPNGSYIYKNKHTGRCIDDSSGYGLRSFGCNGLTYQDWNAS